MENVLKVKEQLEGLIESYGYEDFLGGLVLLEEGRVLSLDEYQSFLEHPTANILSLREIMDDYELIDGLLVKVESEDE